MWCASPPVPFANFDGTIEEVNAPKEQIRVLISLFGRDTPVTLGFSDVEKDLVRLAGLSC